MAAFAALTLIIGVVPDLFFTPITDYVGVIFEGEDAVLPLLAQAEATDGSEMIDGEPAAEEGGGH